MAPAVPSCRPSSQRGASTLRFRISTGLVKVEHQSRPLVRWVYQRSNPTYIDLKRLAMTESTRKLIDEFEEELKKLPEEEQERYVASYLEDLRQKGEPEQAQEDAYSALKILRDAKLTGSEDASVTYENKLYGPHGESDQ